MHKFFVKIIFLFLIISLPAATFSAPGENPKNKTSKVKSSQNTSEIKAFQNSRDWRKLGPRIRQVWLDAMRTGDNNRKLECFVRVRYPADEGDQSFLISKGFIVQIFAGSIARGHMKAQALRQVAHLPFVDSIKLSTPPDKKK